MREFMEQNTVENAIRTETDTRTEYKGVGKLGWLVSKTQTATSPRREAEPVGTCIHSNLHEMTNFFVETLQVGVQLSE